MGKENNENIYINSFEGADIYNHCVRNMKLYESLAGMLPNSLELIKLKEVGLNSYHVKYTNKTCSRDIINIKFRKKVRNGEYVKSHLFLNSSKEKLEKLKIRLDKTKKEKKRIGINKKIEKQEIYIDYLMHLESTIDAEEDSNEWKEKSSEDVREYLYNTPFTINYMKDEKTNKSESIKYKIYKRSSSKSRTGQVLAIREELYDVMMKYSLMGLDIPLNEKTDYAGILSYSSLVGSAIEKTININVNNILIVDDVKSIWKATCNVIKSNPNDYKIFKNDEGKEEKIEFLDSFLEKEYKILNSIFDGESLLQYNYFEKDQSMMLCRQHFFKSASFACDIQLWLKNHCPRGKDYETWKLTNMFGQTIFAKDVHMICTPTSLKAIKSSLGFDKILGSREEVWNYWKDLIESEGNIFGVVKHEKESKRGFDEEGNILQQSSYQQINSIPYDETDILYLTEFEQKYINKLKTDNDFFINYLKENECYNNSNAVFVDLYNVNKDIVDLKLFKIVKRTTLHDYKNHVKRGKVRLKSDYCIICGNPIELLHHAIEQLPVDNGIINYDKWKEKFKDKTMLKNNEIYTTLFEIKENDDNELVCFRNPHTSPSNCLLSKNVKVPEIDEYFKFSKNIVVVNAINFHIQDILSSMDYDSDSMLIVQDDTTLKTVKEKVWGKYRVCLNNIDSEPKPYLPNMKSMFEIDKQLAVSQRNIGEIVNMGQWAMSLYWDEYNKGKNDQNKLKELLKITDVCTILSCVAIDLAKKLYNIDIEKEIDHIESRLKKYIDNKFKRKVERKITRNNETKTIKTNVICKPEFFKYISQSKTIKNKITHYDTSMDYLIKIIDAIPKSDYKGGKDIINFLEEGSLSKVDRDQKNIILEQVDEMVNKINHINGQYKGNNNEFSKDKIKEKNRLLSDTINEYMYKVSKKTVKKDTMYSIIKNSDSKIKTKLLNILYETQKETFLAAFKKDIKEENIN